MQKLLALFLCFTIPLVFIAAGHSYKLTYDGNSVPDLKSEMSMRLFVEVDGIQLSSTQRGSGGFRRLTHCSGTAARYWRKIPDGKTTAAWTSRSPIRELQSPKIANYLSGR